MSTNEQTPAETTTDDLDAFSAAFFGQNKAPKEQASSEEAETEEVADPDASQDDTHSGELDTPADDEDDEEEETPPEEKPKPKKNRFQERIDELTKAAREAERRVADLEAKLNQQNEKPTPKTQAKVDTGPSPDDKNEDGTDKYDLGEFDPKFIRDLTRHTLEVERQAIKAQEEQETSQKEMETQKAALQSEWAEKLGPAQERYPDFQEKGQELLSTFDGIDEAYGEYLTTTLMSLEYGPDVLYYLANNVDEANKIVASGAAKATIALGRLEAKFAYADEEKQKARPKVSKAPTPPPVVNKGSSVARADIPDDTDDLDAFSQKFFVRRR